MHRRDGGQNPIHSGQEDVVGFSEFGPLQPSGVKVFRVNTVLPHAVLSFAPKCEHRQNDEGSPLSQGVHCSTDFTRTFGSYNNTTTFNNAFTPFSPGLPQAAPRANEAMQCGVRTPSSSSHHHSTHQHTNIPSDLTPPSCNALYSPIRRIISLIIGSNLILGYKPMYKAASL